MNRFKSQKGGIALFVIVAFLFTMIILIGIFWKNTNYKVTVLQAERRIKEIYGNDVKNIAEEYVTAKRGTDSRRFYTFKNSWRI